MSWTDERVELLKRLWNEGFSASQCARRLGGVTRNSVIGKIHRLGLSRGTPGINPRVESERRKPKRTPQRKRRLQPPKSDSKTWSWNDYERVAAEHEGALEPEPEVKLEPLPATGPISILELTSRSCRYPLGDEPPFEYCGKPTCARGSGVYCTQHAAICYSGVPGKSDKRFSLPIVVGKRFSPAVEAAE